MTILNILNEDGSHLLSNVTLEYLTNNYVLVKTTNNQMVLIGKSQYPNVKYEWINEEADNKFTFEIFSSNVFAYITYAAALASFFVECAEIIRSKKFKSGGIVSGIIRSKKFKSGGIASGTTRINETGGEVITFPDGSNIIPDDILNKLVNQSAHLVIDSNYTIDSNDLAKNIIEDLKNDKDV